jgi:hypothetical protein
VFQLAGFPALSKIWKEAAEVARWTLAYRVVPTSVTPQVSVSKVQVKLLILRGCCECGPNGP